MKWRHGDKHLKAKTGTITGSRAVNMAKYQWAGGSAA